MSRVKKRWEDEQLLHIRRCAPHTDYERTPEKEDRISLNGSWQFLYIHAPEYSPEGFFDVDFSDSGWDTDALHRRLVSVSDQSSVCAV